MIKHLRRSLEGEFGDPNRPAGVEPVSRPMSSSSNHLNLIESKQETLARTLPPPGSAAFFLKTWLMMFLVYALILPTSRPSPTPLYSRAVFFCPGWRLAKGGGYQTAADPPLRGDSGWWRIYFQNNRAPAAAFEGIFGLHFRLFSDGSVVRWPSLGSVAESKKLLRLVEGRRGPHKHWCQYWAGIFFVAESKHGIVLHRRSKGAPGSRRDGWPRGWRPIRRRWEPSARACTPNPRIQTPVERKSC